ncbi:MAG: Holliday junction branch migration protein RuvA [Candidatus Babeliales bacterium]
MLSYIRGTIKAVSEKSVVIEIGGIGVSIAIPDALSLKLNTEIQLSAYMHWNQENGPTLYGFCTELEKNVFTIIIGCSGIGPKIALAVLSTLSAARFLQAVREHDIKALSSVSGIGAKKAEQMLLQLRDKVAQIYESGVIATEEDGSTMQWKDLSQALGSLNYSRIEVHNALQYLHQTPGTQVMSFDQLLRNALSYLSQKR